MGRFTDWIVSGNAQTPKRLRRGGYAGVWRGLLAGVDSRADDLDAVAARGMLRECRDVDLDAHLRNTRDIRLCDETDDEVRAYLAVRWDAYKEAGTPEGLLRQLRRMHLDNVLIVRELDLRHAAIAGAFGGNTGFYFLVIQQPSPFTVDQGTLWDGGGDWDDGAVWDGLPEGYLDCMRYAIRRWEPAGHSCRYVLVARDNTFVWDPVTFTYTGNADSYPIAKGWEWQLGLQPYYTTTYTTP